ncbi:MAG: PEP-CTERM sorting domain-containing protein [Fimbriimonadales bacterium]
MRGSSMTRALVALGALTVALGLAQAQPVQLVLWNFNDSDTNADAGVNASISSLALVSSTTATFATGSPLDTATTNRGYNTTNYPAQGTGNLTAGIVFNTPTTGYMNVTVQFDVRWSNTASKYLRFQYTYDGVNWNNGPQLVAGGGDWWWGPNNSNTRFLVDFTGDTYADNNPNFAFRILAEFGPSGQYEAALSGRSYATTGTVRYDLVEVRGEVVPEPASLLALGAGVAGLLGLRRRK